VADWDLGRKPKYSLLSTSRPRYWMSLKLSGVEIRSADSFK
jgi:hypothetical protein